MAISINYMYISVMYKTKSTKQWNNNEISPRIYWDEDPMNDNSSVSITF